MVALLDNPHQTKTCLSFELYPEKTSNLKVREINNHPIKYNNKAY
tara:strand:- start:356 stop:490 length:135 start_codon:yes stop_codon:yes gene_type:complete